MVAKKAAKKSTRTARATPSHRTPATPPDSGSGLVGLRVRMYRVGFGDFFLLSVPVAGGKEHILIDCGVFKGTSGEGDIGTIRAAVDNLVEETGGRLALVVMTHRHADHIIGFSRCKEQFQKMTVGAVWMPIWEKEYDDKAAKTKASKFQVDLTAIASRMQTQLTGMAPAAGQEEAHKQTLGMLLNATGPLAAAGGGTNAASLDLLKRGFGVTPEYYAADDKPTVPAVLARAGLSARILGPPPVDDIALMKLMDLTKGVGQYLDGLDDSGASEPAFAPFGTECQVDRADYPSIAFDEWGARADVNGRADRAKPPAERMRQAIEDAQPASLFEAAKTLDSFLNNQSLVILFTFQGKKLLFVGDAQAGNWEHWLYGDGAPDKSASAPISEDGQSILKTLDFYKVGHHGSTNATPKAVVATMRPGIVAMCSTQPGVYGSEKTGTEVPRIPLVEALEARVTLVRSDQIAAHANGASVEPSEGSPASLPHAHEGQLASGDGWVDYDL